MPRRRKQHWNDWNPGSQRINRQNPYNSYQSFQRNSGQIFNNSYSNQANFTPDAGYYYDNSAFQTSYTQNYSNDYYDPSFQRNFPQNGSQSHYNQNYQTRFTTNARNTDYNLNFQRNVPINKLDLNVKSNINNPNFQRNVPRQSSSSINDLIVKSNINTTVQRDIEHHQNQNNIIQNDSTKNIKENPPTSNPWYKTQPNTPKEGRKKKQKGDFLEKYNRKTESFNEKGYIIKETLYQDPSLFYANNDSNVDSPSHNESNDNNWTDTFWQKHDDALVPKVSRMSQSTKVSRKNQNRLERTLNDMLAKPAEMSKGKSLLLKMGWQGGGLGREEDGIIEPIAPKATYAVKTMGLGHLTEKPKILEMAKKQLPFAKVSNKKLKHPEFQNNFCTNVLLYILEFVKNDEENKIVFEPRLRKLERKRIHQIVEKIRISNNLDDFENFENFSDRHLELVKDIWVHNCYELWTESEGEKQNRRICLLKEAPAHVYLVTPEDLIENDEKNDEIGDKNDEYDIIVNIKKEKVSEKIDSEKQNDIMISNDTDNVNDNINYRENCKTDQENDKLNSEDTKIDISQDVNKEISELTDSQMAVDINNQILVSNTFEMTPKVKDSNFCSEIIPNMEINEEIKKDQENYKFNTQNTKIDKLQDIKKEISKSTDSQIAVDINMDDNNQILVSNTPEIAQKVKNIDFCSEIIQNMEINEGFKKDQDKNRFNSEDQKAMENNTDENNPILVKNDNNTLEMTQKIEDSDFCCEIITNMEISDVITISSDESDSESTEMATNNDLSHEINQTNVEIIEENVEIIEENQQILVQNENKISEEVADINICKDIKFEQEINEEYKEIEEKISNSTNINYDTKPKIDNDEQTFNDYLNTYLVLFNKMENRKAGKGSILSKIVEYFKEFSNDETFKEFRFLGPFNSEQIMHINVFFKICMKRDNVENCYEKRELLAAFDNDLVKFDVLEDNNEKRFIQKVGKSPESEEEDEEVRYASGLYL